MIMTIPYQTLGAHAIARSAGIHPVEALWPEWVAASFCRGRGVVVPEQPFVQL